MTRKTPILSYMEAVLLQRGSVSVGGQVKGLYLSVVGSKKIFFLSIIKEGRHRRFKIGEFPEMSPKNARKRAVELVMEHQSWDSFVDPETLTDDDIDRDTSLYKTDPGDYSKADVRKVVYEWIHDRYVSGYWSCDEIGERMTRRMFENHVFPHIGNVNINTVTTAMVANCLRPIWREKHSTAIKLQGYLKHFFSWAIGTQRCTLNANPAARECGLDVYLINLSRHLKPSENHAACAVEEIPRLIKELHHIHGFSARACEFGILTAARSKAVRAARWQEFDLERGIWTIPPEHDKIKELGRDRTIYLSSAAVRLLTRLPHFVECDLVFPTNYFLEMSDMTPLTVFRRLHQRRRALDGTGWIDPVKSKNTGKPCTITFHGTCRASFRTWAKDDERGNNRRFDQEAVELCLLHAKNDGYQGAYDRATLKVERQLVMEEWGKYCTQLIED